MYSGSGSDLSPQNDTKGRRVVSPKAYGHSHSGHLIVSFEVTWVLFEKWLLTFHRKSLGCHLCQLTICSNLLEPPFVSAFPMTRSPEKHSQICQQQAYKADETHLSLVQNEVGEPIWTSYCWWLKSKKPTKDDNYPIIYRVLPIPNGAGFQSSTVELPFDGC